MPFDIPQHRLLAEAQAWPLSARYCFDAVQLELPRNARGSRERGLLESIHQQLRPKSGGMSLDGIAKVRELAWFGKAASTCETSVRHPDRIALNEYLADLAARYLELDASGIRLRWDDGDELSRRELSDAFHCARGFRWLTLCLPADLLVAALAAAEGKPARNGFVSLVTPALRRVLERPVAQSHLHVGAAMGFPYVWTRLMARLASPGSVLEASPFERGGPPPFETGAAFCLRLVQAALIRLLLGWFLRGPETTPLFPGNRPECFARSWLSQARRARPNWSPGEAMRSLERVRNSLLGTSSKLEDESIHVQRLYQHLVAEMAAPGPRSADILLQDPLCSVLLPLSGGPERPLDTSSALAEAHFTHRALTYLTRPDADRDFVRLFWQYQRIRCMTYAHVTQAPGTSGLDWFTRHYDRISAVRGDADRFIVSFALAADARETNLASLEARTSPSRSAQSVVTLLRSYAEQVADYEAPNGVNRPEFGVVLHFLKSPDPNKLLAGKQRRGFAFGRYAPWYLERDREALAMETALKWYPTLLLVLRGVDVCNVELALPVWPLLPLFDKVRRASQIAAAKLAHQKPLWRVEPLRATCHVGEEYRRLVEGLRHMHEVVFYRLLRRGDRIGHGLALAHDPEDWAAVAPVVAQPRQDRLDDLLWELDRYSAGDLEPEPGRLERVRAEARRLGEVIYGDEGLDALRDARHFRHRLDKLKRLNYPYVRPLGGTAGLDRATHLLHRYLKDFGVWLRGEEPIEVHVDESELRLLVALQAWLRRVLAKLEITIETNPSSNLVVADYRDIRQHPAFVMRPLEEPSTSKRSLLPVSINTDDPVTFATSLADEYAHLYFALLGQGFCAQEALAWLDEVRECGWAGRFTLPASREPKALRTVATR